MKLFSGEAKVEFDIDGAQAFKDSHEAAIKAKEAESEALTGKYSKKARTEKSKEASATKADVKYVVRIRLLKVDIIARSRSSKLRANHEVSAIKMSRLSEWWHA